MMLYIITCSERKFKLWMKEQWVVETVKEQVQCYEHL